MDAQLVVTSPLQVLNAAEGRHHWGIGPERCQLVVGWAGEARADHQLRSMVRATDWPDVVDLPPRGRRTQLPALVRAVRAVADDPEPVDLLFLGDPLSPLLRHVGHRRRARQVWYLDDGSSAPGAVRARRAEAAGTRHREGSTVHHRWRDAKARASRALGIDSRPLPAVGWFSLYDLDVPASDRLERNTYDWLRQRFPPAAPEGFTLALGCPLVELGAVTEDAYARALARGLADLPRPVWYQPHRREDPERVARLLERGGYVASALDGPVEYHLLASGRLPAAVVGIWTTALDTLAVLLPPEVRVAALSPAPSTFGRGWRDYAAGRDDQLRRHAPGPLEVVDV